MFDWIAYQIVMRTPLGKHTLLFLPAAGRWAYRNDPAPRRPGKRRRG